MVSCNCSREQQVEARQGRWSGGRSTQEEERRQWQGEIVGECCVPARSLNLPPSSSTPGASLGDWRHSDHLVTRPRYGYTSGSCREGDAAGGKVLKGDRRLVPWRVDMCPLLCVCDPVCCEYLEGLSKLLGNGVTVDTSAVYIGSEKHLSKCCTVC